MSHPRRFAFWLAIFAALALPLAGAGAEEAEEDEAKPAAAESAAQPDESAPADEEEESDEDEGEDEGDESEWELTHRGLYLTGEGAFAFLVTKSDLEDEVASINNLDNLNSHVDDSWGYGGRLGWRLMERVALEGQFQILNEIAIHQRSAGTNFKSEATFLTATGNVKGFLLTQQFQPYLLLGAGYGHSDIDPAGQSTHERDDGFVARFGTGIDIYLTDAFGVMSELSYVLPTGNVSDFDYVTIGFGLTLRFYGGD
jgi:hypothetical protein